MKFEMFSRIINFSIKWLSGRDKERNGENFKSIREFSDDEGSEEEEEEDDDDDEDEDDYHEAEEEQENDAPIIEKNSTKKPEIVGGLSNMIANFDFNVCSPFNFNGQTANNTNQHVDKTFLNIEKVKEYLKVKIFLSFNSKFLIMFFFQIE